jgi:energy-converting hydrogenase B subunit D
MSMTVLFLLVVREKDLLRAVVYLAGSGFCLTAIFLMLRAPDIAITQASIEVILVTVIFVVAIEKTRRFEE